MVSNRIFYLIFSLLISSSIAINNKSVVDIDDKNSTKLESSQRTENFDQISSGNVENSAQVLDDDERPRDKRALGIFLQGLAEALGYSPSPISLATLPNPNTTVAGAAAVPPPVFTFPGIPPLPPAAAAAPPPAPLPVSSPRVLTKPNPPTASPQNLPPGSLQFPAATTATPRRRETLRFTGVVNFGNNSDLLGHLQQYERLFHGNATTPASASPSTTAAPNPSSPKAPQARPLLTPFLVRIPLPIAPNLPPPLPLSAPRQQYGYQDEIHKYKNENKDISEEEYGPKETPIDTYVDEPPWKQRQRDEQEKEEDENNNGNYNDDDEPEDNEEKTKYREQQNVDNEKDNSTEDLNEKEEDDEEAEENPQDNRNNRYREDEEEAEDSAENYEANKTSLEDQEKEPEKYQNEGTKNEKHKDKNSYDDDYATIRNHFQRYQESFKLSPQHFLSQPFSTGLPIRVFDESSFDEGNGPRNSYGQSLEHEGKVDESVADYFQNFKDPQTGLYDSRKFQLSDNNRRGFDPREGIKRPRADARYEEYNLQGREGKNVAVHRSEKGRSREELNRHQQQRRRKEEIEDEEDVEEIEPTLMTYREIEAPTRKRRTKNENQPKVTTYKPIRLQARNSGRQNRRVETNLSITHPSRSHSTRGKKYDQQDAAVEATVTTFTRVKAPENFIKSKEDKLDFNNGKKVTNVSLKISTVTERPNEEKRIQQANTKYTRIRGVDRRIRGSKKVGEIKKPEAEVKTNITKGITTENKQLGEEKTEEPAVATNLRSRAFNLRRSSQIDRENSDLVVNGKTNETEKVLDQAKTATESKTDEVSTSSTYPRSRESELKRRLSKKFRKNLADVIAKKTNVSKSENKSDNEKTEEPPVTAKTQRRETANGRKAEEISEDDNEEKLTATTYRPESKNAIETEITKRSSENAEDDSNENLNRRNLSDDNESVEVPKTLELTKFDFVKYSPYVSPVQVDYEPKKLQITADKILELHNYGYLKNPSESNEENETKNDEESNFESVKKPSTDAQLDDGEIFKYKPYLRPIQYVYDPEKLQRTADKILSSQHQNENEEEEIRNADAEDPQQLREQNGSSENLENDENVRIENPLEIIRENDRSSENLNDDENESSENLNTDINSPENLNNDESNSSENFTNDENSSENLNNNSSENLETDENLSENIKSDERSSKDSRENNGSENLRKSDDDEYPSIFQQPEEFPPNVGLPSRLTGKSLHESESKEFQAWPAPFDHTYDSSSEEEKIIKPEHPEYLSDQRDEDVEQSVHRLQSSDARNYSQGLLLDEPLTETPTREKFLITSKDYELQPEVSQGYEPIFIKELRKNVPTKYHQDYEVTEENYDDDVQRDEPSGHEDLTRPERYQYQSQLGTPKPPEEEEESTIDLQFYEPQKFWKHLARNIAENQSNE